MIVTFPSSDQKARRSTKPNAIKRVVMALVSAAILPVLALGGLSVALVAVSVPRNVQISPFDEYVYLDYLHKFPTQIVERQGEETGAYARSVLACRGVLIYGSYGNGCGNSTRDDSKFPYDGAQGADIYTPAYFAATWALSLPLRAVGIDELDAGRLTGAFWLALGAILLYLTLRQLRIGKVLALALPMLVLATPAVHWANTYLSTDAPTLAVASALAYLGVRIWSGLSSPWWLVPISIIAVLLKLQNLAAVAITGIVLLVLCIARARESRSWPSAAMTLWTDKTSRVVVLSTVGALAAQVIWVVVRSRIALPPDGSSIAPSDVFTPTALFAESTKFFLSVGSAGASSGLAGSIAATLLQIVTIASVLGLVLIRERNRLGPAVVAATTFGVATAFGPLLVIATYVAVGSYIPLTPRYGLVFLAAFVVCCAIFVQRYVTVSWAKYALLASGVILIGFSIAV